jgi:urease gamma subunit
MEFPVSRRQLRGLKQPEEMHRIQRIVAYISSEILELARKGTGTRHYIDLETGLCKHEFIFQHLDTILQQLRVNFPDTFIEKVKMVEDLNRFYEISLFLPEILDVDRVQTMIVVDWS